MDLPELDGVDKKFQKELNTGVSSLILLSVLNKAEDRMYGYQIAKLIEESCQSVPAIKLGTLYPVLRSLEESCLLQSEVEPSITGPPRRYYRITDRGREALKRWTEIWLQTQKLVKVQLMGVSHDQYN